MIKCIFKCIAINFTTKHTEKLASIYHLPVPKKPHACFLSVTVPAPPKGNKYPDF